MSETEIHPAIDELAPRVLHGLADETEQAELGRLLALSTANRRRFIEHSSLHGMLAQEAKAGAFAENRINFFQKLEQRPDGKHRRLKRFWIPAAAAVLVACLVAIPLLTTTASAALEQVIKAMNTTRDRTYRIEVLEPGSEDAPVRNGDRGRFPPAKYLDGASLWLRGPGEFVLRQTLPNGSVRIMGSDGSTNWSLRGDGPVHVTRDPGRFGGAIVARSGDFTGADLRSQLEDLKNFYQIEWLDRSGDGPWKLRASRRSADQGGAHEVEVWFDQDSGLLERMILSQLPRANGGPRSIAYLLESTDPLPPDFFNHTHHHEPGRAVIPETEP
jgi:hypothetical protein